MNCCSPGTVRTEAYAGLAPAQREAMFKATGESLPLGRVGQPHEIAQAVLLMMTNTYLTGHVLDIDGGHMVRQYAACDNACYRRELQVRRRAEPGHRQRHAECAIEKCRQPSEEHDRHKVRAEERRHQEQRGRGTPDDLDDLRNSKSRRIGTCRRGRHARVLRGRARG